MIAEIFEKLKNNSGFSGMFPGAAIMVAISLALIYLAIAKNMSPCFCCPSPSNAACELAKDRHNGGGDRWR